MRESLTRRELAMLSQKPRPNDVLIGIITTIISVLLFIILFSGLLWVVLWLLSSVATFFN